MALPPAMELRVPCHLRSLRRMGRPQAPKVGARSDRPWALRADAGAADEDVVQPAQLDEDREMDKVRELEQMNRHPEAPACRM